MVRKKKEGVDPEPTNVMAITTIEPRYTKVILFVDIMFVNRLAVLTTLSKHLHFRTAEGLTSLSNRNLEEGLKKTISTYRSQGFTVTKVLGDRQFAGTQRFLSKFKVTLNLTARDEHVPQIERFHQTIKERCRSAYHNTPFQHLPWGVVLELIRSTLFYLNGFPWAKGISKNISPLEIVTGMKLDYNKHCQYQFREYAHAQEETDNTLKQCTTRAIVLRPTRNSQGSMRLYSLTSGWKIVRSPNDIRILPMPVTETVRRLNTLANSFNKF